ncbi:MAG: hypothetical protein AAGH92_01180 [Planctomycetota bacterium]
MNRNAAEWLVGTCLSLCVCVTAPLTAESWRPLGEPGVGGRLTGLVVSPHDPQRVLVAGDMLGVGLSTDGGDSWQPTTGFLSWEMADFTWHPTDPDVVWVGSMGGPYVSRDGGATWSPSRSGMPSLSNFSYTAPIESIRFDPNNADRLLAFGGSLREWDAAAGSPRFGSVWESLDGGANWSEKTRLTANGSSTGGGVAGINVLAADFAGSSSDTLFATVLDQGVYRTTDGGANWNKRNLGLPHTDVKDLATDPGNPNVAYVSLDSDDTTPGGVYRTVNGGITWSPVNSGLSQVSGSNGNLTSRYLALERSAFDPNKLLTGDARFGTSIGLAQTTNAGTSWQTVYGSNDADTYDPSGPNVRIITTDPSNPDRFFAAGDAYVLRTTDGGDSWEDITSDRVGDGYIGNGYTGWVSTNVTFDPADPDRMIVQAFDAARVILTTDGRQSWRHVATSPNPFNGGRDAVFAGDTIYATLGQANFAGVARSEDGGDTWTTLSGGARGLPELSTGSPPRGIHATADKPDTVWAVINGDLKRSTDRGDTWANVLTDDSLRWIEADPNDPSTFYVSGNDGVYLTTNGVDFTDLGGPGERGRMAIEADGSLLLAAHQSTGDPGEGVWRYDGVGWTQVLNNDRAVDVAASSFNINHIAVSTSDDPFRDVAQAEGVLFSVDRGRTWRSLNAGLPMLRGDVLAFNPHDPYELVFGTNGRGFFSIDTRLAVGDFDESGTLDSADVDELFASVGRPAVAIWQQYDLVADGTIDDQDVMHWITEIAQTQPGDTNLDGVVDQADLNAVLNNWGASNTGWAGGDTDGTGTVEQGDLNAVLNTWGFRRQDTPSISTRLPEPGIAGFAYGAMLLITRRHRR